MQQQQCHYSAWQQSEHTRCSLVGLEAAEQVGWAESECGYIGGAFDIMDSRVSRVIVQ
jgi:hypothetical protein